VKRYEGLFILKSAGKEEGIKDVIDKISHEITSIGGRVETVQKMDKRAFARIKDKKITSGYYVNIIFECLPGTLAQLRSRFVMMSEDVYRVLLTKAGTAVLPEEPKN
jgi:ribosomal protein S6